ncbi:GNAT family N-acetyltransferase [Aquabacterium sp.]|uniref:GNAT family N-acetyltransferase n=1 Tax=Aquabacterium sp. TaxID=1872578 RepID=UPI00378341ED
MDPAVLHAAFGDAFADYLIGPFQLALEAWPAFLARQAVDLSLSRVAVSAQQGLLAFAFVAARPAARRWRLATMGARPVARGSGAAPALLDDFIARARAAGQQAVELEVFAQNERALRLYQGRGFVERHELFGYRLAGSESEGEPAAAAGAAAQPVARDDALAWLRATEARIGELPLQVTADVLSALAPPWQAWRRGAAQLVFSAADGGPLVLHSLIDTSPDQADAALLLQALRAQYPTREIRVPQLQRNDLGGRALEAAGFERLPLHQLWLRLDLS